MRGIGNKFGTDLFGPAHGGNIGCEQNDAAVGVAAFFTGNGADKKLKNAAFVVRREVERFRLSVFGGRTRRFHNARDARQA